MPYPGLCCGETKKAPLTNLGARSKLREMDFSSISTIVLAAGASTRMKSSKSKLLHEILGKTLIRRSFELVSSISHQNIFVVGKESESIKKELNSDRAFFGLQEIPLGTADAVKIGLESLEKNFSSTKDVFICGGDSVLLRSESLKSFVDKHQQSSAVMSLISCDWPGASAYGRVKRDSSGRVEKIVEHKNADFEERKISEINAGFYIFHLKKLRDALGEIKKNEKTGEFYITDLVEYFSRRGDLVLCEKISDHTECLGINTMQELAEAQRILNRRNCLKWMSQGALIQDVETTWIEDSVRLASDVKVGPGVVLRGQTEIQCGAEIEAYCILIDSKISEQVKVKAFSHVESAVFEKNSQVGPFARIRPGTKLSENVRIGNFVETKNSQFAANSKANHLSYIGDAIVGESSNVGAGTITCNYDGFMKHQTKIGSDVFIGSNTSLVAPVELGNGAMVAAGSVITKSVPADGLAVERSEQKNIDNAARRFRARRRK